MSVLVAVLGATGAKGCTKDFMLNRDSKRTNKPVEMPKKPKTLAKR